MPAIDSIVSIQIDRQTTAVSRAGFGILMILDAHKNWNDRIRYYSSADAILDDGFDSGDDAYLAALAAFSQSPKPGQVAIGRRTVDEAGVEVTDVQDNTDYTTTINGTTATYTSGSGATASSIAGGLVTAINGLSEPVTASDDGDGTYTLNADTSGEPYSLEVDAKQTVEPLSPTNNPDSDLAEIVTVDDDWYALALTSHTQSEVENAAAWVEAQRKIFGTASSDTDILDATVDTDIASVLKSNAYNRSFVLYHDQADSEYPECAWMGNRLPTDPGSSTWMFKTLSGIPVTKLTVTEAKNALDKNANTYEVIGGVNVTREGTMGSGEYIDVIRGIDWLHARMAERIYSRLVNVEKIPFTNAGIGIIETEIRSQLEAGIDQGLLAGNPEPTVSVPDASEVSDNDKANRLLPDMEFEATLAGAIHEVSIQGVVTV